MSLYPIERSVMKNTSFLKVQTAQALKKCVSLIAHRAGEGVLTGTTGAWFQYGSNSGPANRLHSEGRVTGRPKTEKSHGNRVRLP